ncbi:Tn3 family transposase [Nocardia sp. NPDC023852]|uniref:Tn3 family transposase n=1 Tax=Nocardia sp. NPDC023852 TaxID=3154697 RepID=UPI0033E0C3BB
MADDEPYRRKGKAQANLGEGRHDLARRIYYGKKGEMTRTYYEGTATRPWLSGTRRRRGTALNVHPHPHRHRRPLRLSPTRLPGHPPAAARPRYRRGRLRPVFDQSLLSNHSIVTAGRRSRRAPRLPIWV